MKSRLAGAILLLYPRRVRAGHGPEIVALIEDLIAFDRRSRAAVFMRLAVDGVIQRMTSTATAWLLAAGLGATSLGALAISDLAAASAFQHRPTPVHTGAPTRQTSQTPYRLPSPHASRPSTPAESRVNSHAHDGHGGCRRTVQPQGSHRSEYANHCRSRRIQIRQRHADP